MPATTSINLTGNHDIDGILGGSKWTSPNLTFGFPTALSQYGYSQTGFSALNSTQMTAVRDILSMYASYSNLTFTEVTDNPGTATLRFAEEANAGTAYGYLPSNDTLGYGGDIWLNPTDYNNPLKGTYAYATFMHEIGHTLGFDHGQDGRDALPTDHDSLEYSVMTYRSYVGADLNGYTAAQGSYPQTLMQDDIAALQYLYGANYTTNSGNTTYTWSATTGAMSINGVEQTASTTNKIFMTLWDGGGADTYDLSNYTTNLTIDLTPGGWTTTSTAQLASLGFQGQVARGNIANALLYQGNVASLIENAKGGTGNDTILGNQANNVLDGGNGDDKLTGGLGNDTIIGGLGVDTCVLGINYAACTVTYDDITGVFTLTSQLEGIDTTFGVEYLKFLEQTIATSGLTNNTLTPPADTTAPTLTGAVPADNAGSVAKSANLVLTFSEAVLAGGGSIVIHNADTSVFATIAANNTSLVSISGSTVTINPASDLIAGSSYYITVDGTAFSDGDSNNYAGITSTTALNFTIAADVSTTINGTSKDNTLTGTDANNIINGLAGNDKIDGKAGNDTIDGGTGNDTMTGGSGNDTFIVDSTRDTIKENSGGGTDLIKSSVSFTIAANVEGLTLTGSSAINGTGNDLNNIIIGNSGKNILSGNGGIDALFGMSGDDTLSGGAGDDGLSGGAGKDTLTGGTGKDYFVFDTAIGSSNVDKITDFSVVDDTIALDNSVFTAFSADGAINSSQFAIGSSAANSSTKLFYNSTSGALFYDADGNGNGAAIQIATLTAHLSLTSADFFII